ncbi:MAG TPA: SH3 domain-containing protein [Alphaproteobacteria bacterium]|nr:SH3 domain-containing protein [Alphaproteobacteria bacterium]
MNAAFRSRLGASLLILLGLSLTTARADAQGLSSTPEGYQPGWQITVYKAGVQLAPSPGKPLTAFAAPAAGFDMGSYRGAVEEAFNFGLAYDASGMLNIAAKGKYALSAKASWLAEYLNTPEARCAISLAVDGAPPATWTGAIGSVAGEQSVTVDTDLEPGLRKADLHVACDKPLGSRFRVELAMQGPGDSTARPLGPIELLHAAPPNPTIVPGTVAAETPSPAAEMKPTSPAPVPRSAASPQAPAAKIAISGQTLVAVADIRVRSAPRENAPTLGILPAGREVEVSGMTPDSEWYHLAQGGYASAGFLKPAGSAGPPRPIARRRH